MPSVKANPSWLEGVPYQLKKIPHTQKVDASDQIEANRIGVIYPTDELKVLLTRSLPTQSSFWVEKVCL